jgi:RNA polymerase sigma-70 factor (ECF subfamily)
LLFVTRSRGDVDEVGEAELLRRIGRSDAVAFEEFYHRTVPWLVVRLRRRCADREIVAEVVQDTYLAVWRAGASFTGERAGGSAVGWLWTIAAHRLVDAFRRRARDAELPPAAVEELVAPAAEEEVLSGEVSGEVGIALCRLAPDLQQVLRAMVLDGLSVRETAALLGLSEGAVKTRARRARIAMRKALS